MILVNLLATTCLITFARGSPMSYATYRRREFPIDERPELLLLYDQRGLQNTDSSSRSAYEMAERDYGNEIALNDGISDIPNESTISRDKKITLSQKSLSISNPIEVLRERVLLELARNRAAQNQLQVDANRRLLDSVGKRSLHEFDSGFPRNVGQSTSSANERGTYGNNQQSAPRHDDHQSASYTQRIPIERTHEWYKVDDSVMRRGNGDDEARKILATYHHDRM